jgi:hypothetical protein
MYYSDKKDDLADSSAVCDLGGEKFSSAQSITPFTLAWHLTWPVTTPAMKKISAENCGYWKFARIARWLGWSGKKWGLWDFNAFLWKWDKKEESKTEDREREWESFWELPVTSQIGISMNE